MRLCNGQTVKLEVNHDHTVRDLFKYVEVVSPVMGTYALLSGFPPKPLTDMDLTLE